jgi:GGDEF domain-containing protein
MNFGLILFIIFQTIIIQTNCYAQLPEGSIESPFKACQNEIIVPVEKYQKNSDQWNAFESKCKIKIRMSKEAGLDSLNPLNEGLKYIEFATKVAQKVEANLVKSRKFADCTAICFQSADSCQKTNVPNESQIDCNTRKKEILDRLKSYSKKIRTELALSRPYSGIVDVNIRNVLNIANDKIDKKEKLINSTLQDFELATPNPLGIADLNDFEKKDAEKILDNEIKKIDEDSKIMGIKNIEDWKSIKLMERFNAHQEQYRQLIYEEAPIFGVIEKAKKFDDQNNPIWSEEQIANAFLKLSQNAKLTEEKVIWSQKNAKLEFNRENSEALRKWLFSFNSKNNDTHDLLFFMGMKNQVEEVLAHDPASCGVATAMGLRLKSKELQNQGITLAASVASSFIGRIAGGAFGLMRSLSAAEIANSTGLALGSAYLGDSFRDLNSKTSEAQTTSGLGGNKEGSKIRSVKEVDDAREHLKLALMMAPLDVPAAKFLSQRAFASAKKLRPAPLIELTGTTIEKRVLQKNEVETIERRLPTSTTSKRGEVLETLNPYELPTSMRLRKYKNEAGEEIIMYEKIVLDSNNKSVIQSRELTLDPLTGAFDANYPSGKLFLEDLIKEKAVKSTLAFIDVNNLGYVNNNFLKGRIAGDEYLAAIAKAITKATDGKAQLFKLGGDEYGVLLHEADPVKAQSILQKIIDSCYSKEVHQSFRENSIARAETIRSQRIKGPDGKLIPLTTEEKKAITEYSPYSREGISIGAVSVEKGNSLEQLLQVAESQAVKQKIITKNKLNISSKKYGGTDAIDGAIPNLKYKPIADRPATVTELPIIKNSSQNQKSELNISSISDYGKEEVINEKFRFGEISVIENKLPDGSIVLKYNRFFKALNGTQNFVTRELVLNSKVGLIDGTHESGQFILNRLCDGKSATLHSRGLLWINAENLGKINYFKNGTATGDKLLAETAKTIEKEVRAGGVSFKMQGSEFILVQEGLSKESISILQKRIQQSLVNNPEIKKIYSDQLQFIKEEISTTKLLTQTPETEKKLVELNTSFESVSKMKPQYSLENHIFTESDNLETATELTKGRLKNEK